MSKVMMHWLRHTQRPDALIAIPLHHRRLRQRGYDQAYQLAKPLARHFKLPLLTQVLIRQQHTAAQTRLDLPQRKRNMRHAFKIEKTQSLPRHIALIDDVMTTGATLDSAARVLLKHGAERVDAWVCARVPPPNH